MRYTTVRGLASGQPESARWSCARRRWRLSVVWHRRRTLAVRSRLAGKALGRVGCWGRRRARAPSLESRHGRRNLIARGHSRRYGRPRLPGKEGAGPNAEPESGCRHSAWRHRDRPDAQAGRTGSARSRVGDRRIRGLSSSLVPIGQPCRPLDPWRGLTWPPHWNAALLQMLFEIGHADEAEMEDGSGEGRISSAGLEYLDKVLDGAGAPRGDDGNAGDGSDGTGKIHVKTILRAVAVHGSEEKFSSTSFLGFLRPGYGVSSGGVAAAG